MPVPNMTSAPTREVNAELNKLNKGKRYELTKYQQRQINDSEPFYIYNVSPIHEWPKFQGQLGTLTIRKRAAKEQVSEPLIIPGAIARWFDKGLGRKEVFIEDGREVAEDICGCSKEYPAESANNNLTNFGVFILDKPFEELEEEERATVLFEANAKLIAKLRGLMLEADNYHIGTPQQRAWISPIHHAAMHAFNDLTGSNEKRPWATIGASVSAQKASCQFCGSVVNLGVVKCPSCNEVIDAEGYAALKKKKG
jgi:hypothetical protein